MAKVIRTEPALDDLHEIVQYISQDSYAERVSVHIVEAPRRLTNFPLCGRVVPEFQSETIVERTSRPPQANCNPCHFPGGKVYKKLPFDDSVTVTKLGKKLNTRSKKKEQEAMINWWIQRGAKDSC